MPAGAAGRQLDASRCSRHEGGGRGSWGHADVAGVVGGAGSGWTGQLMPTATADAYRSSIT